MSRRAIALVYEAWNANVAKCGPTTWWLKTLGNRRCHTSLHLSHESDGFRLHNTLRIDVSVKGK
jgi:hypothetical protein